MDQNGPDVGPNGSEMDEKPFPGLIFPGHISEQKWNRNSPRCTRYGPKWSKWVQMDHMGLNGPDTSPNGLEIEENPSLLALSFVIAFLKRNGTEMRQDGPDMVPKLSYGPKWNIWA